MAEATAAVIKGLTLLKLGINIGEEVVKNSPAASSVGKAFYHVITLAEKRTVLGDAAKYDGKVSKTGDCKNPDPVESPAVVALRNLYQNMCASGVVYVMYDKAGMGKTAAGIALLKSFFVLEKAKQNVKGIMITGDGMERDYASKMTSELGVNNVNGWLHALLLALDQPKNQHPSILLLDAFNDLGEDNLNKDFIKFLYTQMNRLNAKKNIFVVVMTQEEKVANELCQANGGQRIQPLPGYFTGDKQSPIWNNTPWTRGLLMGAIRYENPGEFEEDEQCTFIEEGMTPLEASQRAIQELRRRNVTGEAPTSPRKVKRARI